jgi:hypothetical protein
MDKFINFLVDMAPFVMYFAVLIKLYRSYRAISKAGISEAWRARVLGILALLTLVIGTLLASNAYALAIYGKTFMSLRVFQMFIMGNCVVYWLIIDVLIKVSVSDQEVIREPTK